MVIGMLLKACGWQVDAMNRLAQRIGWRGKREGTDSKKEMRVNWGENGKRERVRGKRGESEDRPGGETRRVRETERKVVRDAEG